MKNKLKYMKMGVNLAERKLRKNSGKVSNLPIHLQVEVTNNCNLQCATCHRDLLYPDPLMMSFEKFRKIFDEVRPLKINVSGIGEPFLNPDIFKMIRYAKQNGASVNCATNFTKVGGKIEELVDSGIDQCKVSVDAATQESYHRIRAKDKFNVLISNILELNDVKKQKGVDTPQIRFNYALQQDNIDELFDTIQIANELNIKSMYIQYLEYIDRENRKERLVGDLTYEKLNDVLKEADKLATSLGITTNLKIWFRDFDLFWNKMQPSEQFKPNNKSCYFPWFSAWVDANGTVRPCPIIPWQLGVAHMGNVFRQSFKEINNNKKYQDLRKSLANGERPTDPCKTCIPQSLYNIFHVGTKLTPVKK